MKPSVINKESKRFVTAFKRLQKTKSLKQREVARTIGMTQPLMSMIAAGKQNLPPRYIVPFCSTYGVNYLYITEGKKPIFGKGKIVSNDSVKLWREINKLKAELITLRRRTDLLEATKGHRR